MRLDLIKFQGPRVDELLGKAQEMREEHSRAPTSLSALSLSAPTGAGKTVMAAAWMEALLEDDPKTSFLWLTDQPALNAQTSRKLRQCSNRLKLLTITNQFDEPLLPEGTVSFVNTQLLGTGKLLVTEKPEERDFLFWRTVSNMVTQRGASFWLILDEAHRGAQEKGGERTASPLDGTIMQAFVTGEERVGLAPVPLLLGISATPDRFLRIVTKQGRDLKQVRVTPKEVRESGLIKPVIVIEDEEQAKHNVLGDLGTLKRAAEQLRGYEREWTLQADCAGRASEKGAVRPLLIVQVENKVAPHMLGERLAVIEEGLKRKLRAAEVAHCFSSPPRKRTADPTDEDEGVQERGVAQEFALANGERNVTYIRPSEIEETEPLRVVFFKTALTTGWDCPRAEVMMSFRGTDDATVIAQLIGRMVRAPLTERVRPSQERPELDVALLNSVKLFLPHYDKDSTQRVVAYLTKDEMGEGRGEADDGGISVNPITLRKRRDKAARGAFEVAAQLPVTYAPPSTRVGIVQCVADVAQWLADDEGRIRALGGTSLMDVPDGLRSALVSALHGHYEKVAETGSFLDRLDGTWQLATTEQRFDTEHWSEIGRGEKGTVDVHAKSINEAFELAGRLFAGKVGLHQAYLRAYANDDDPDCSNEAIKRRLWALSEDANAILAVKEAARAYGKELRRAYIKQTEGLPAGAGDRYAPRWREISGDVLKPGERKLVLPPTMEDVPAKDKHPPRRSYGKHLYVDDSDQYENGEMNKAEREVIKRVIDDEDVVGWVRNQDGVEGFFSIAYEKDGDLSTAWPDFIVFRLEDGRIVCDLYEPHGKHLSDSIAKARGFARFVEEHFRDARYADLFGKAVFLAPLGSSGSYRCINLHEDRIRRDALKLTSTKDYRDLLEDSPAA